MWSKLDISYFYAECLGIKNTDFLEPVREGNLPGQTRRPRDCHLSISALQDLGIDTSETESFESWFRRELSGQ